MKVSIIRHGMTEANEKRLYCGRTDVPLGEHGRLSLAALKETVAYPSAEIYISSGLSRADESLRILYDREPDSIIEEFMEMDFGDFEMKSYDELKDKPEYQRWTGDIDNVSCPHGESKVDFNSRVMIGLTKLSDMKVGSAVVITHGGVIVSIMERLFPGKKNFYGWQPGLGRGYTLDISLESAAKSAAESAALISEI